MTHFQTEQETFWASDFCENYMERNKGEKLIASNLNLFNKVISRTQNIQSVIEIGANIGLNIDALKQLLPAANFSAVEINQKVTEELNKKEYLKVYNHSILDLTIDTKRDLVLTKGLLIHLNPDVLETVYEKIYQLSSKYICIVEYYNPVPVSIQYRGHSNKLFKRDFAGEILDKYSDLKLIDYGFLYHRDPNFPQDDLTWFLLKK